MGIDQVARSGKVRVFDPAERDPGSSGERGIAPVVRIYLLSLLRQPLFQAGQGDSKRLQMGAQERSP